MTVKLSLFTVGLCAPRSHWLEHIGLSIEMCNYRVEELMLLHCVMNCGLR